MGLLIVFVILAVVVGLCSAIWTFVPRFTTKDTQLVWKNSLILALVSMYLMWAITYLAQLNPLVVPRRSDLREAHPE